MVMGGDSESARWYSPNAANRRSGIGEVVMEPCFAPRTQRAPTGEPQWSEAQSAASNVDRRPISRTLLRSAQTTLQTKLTVGPADDRFERNADAVAEQVVSRLRRGVDLSDLQSKGALAQRVVSMDGLGADGGELGDDADSGIRSAKGRGRPLDPGTQEQMEGAFGADFGRIRLHTDPNADQLSRSLSADAFTTGADIFFRSGVYDPTTATGTKVLAHELAHTVQQGAASPVVNRIQRSTAEPPVVQRLFGANAKKHVKTNSYPAIEATLAKAQRGAATEAEINKALKAVERHQKIAAKIKGGDVSGQMATLRNLARYLGDELGFARDRIRMAATNKQAKAINAGAAGAGAAPRVSSAPAMSGAAGGLATRASGQVGTSYTLDAPYLAEGSSSSYGDDSPYRDDSPYLAEGSGSSYGVDAPYLAEGSGSSYGVDAPYLAEGSGTKYGRVTYAVREADDRYPVRGGGSDDLDELSDDEDFSLSEDEDFSFSEDEDFDSARQAKHGRTLKVGAHYATESTVGSPDLPFIIAQGEQLVGEGRVPSIHVFMQQHFGWSAGDVDKYIIAKEASKVAYLNEDERKGYILNGGGTMTQGEDDEPFDTSSMFSKHSGKGFGIYVMAQDGTLYADQHKVGLFHHSSFLSGGDVAGAGEIKVIGGKVQCVTNKTGHYRAGDPELWQVLDELKSRGVNLAGVEVRNDPRSTAPYPGGAAQFYEDHRP
jgi:hypothetical protein